MKTATSAVVLGLGRSGYGAARLLRSEGTAVWVIDGDAAAQDSPRAACLRELGADVACGPEALPDQPFDLAVVSPGFSEHAPWLDALRERGVPLVSELELGWRRAGCRCLAITGSLGKSTAALWCRDALKRAGYRVGLGGNFGVSICDLMAEEDAAYDWLVLEVSSFQLETVDVFRPDVGLLINIKPNHLDRHGSMENYLAVKSHLFERMTGAEPRVLPLELIDEVSACTGARGHVVSFGCGDEADWQGREGQIIHRGKAVLSLEGSLYDNPILAENAAGIVASLVACGVSLEDIHASLMELQALPHRMQEVRCHRGVHFVDDSKATCLAALEAAIHMIPGPVRLIAGGRLKELYLDSVKEILARREVNVYLIGEAAPLMYEAWKEIAYCTVCGDIPEAVEKAWRDAYDGDTILLSPGCTSFDQYAGFEERGRAFSDCAMHIESLNTMCAAH